MPQSYMRYGTGTYSPKYPYNANNNLINQRYPSIPSKNLNPPYRQYAPSTTTIVSMVPLSPQIATVRSMSTPSMQMHSAPTNGMVSSVQSPLPLKFPLPPSLPIEYNQALNNYVTSVQNQHAR